MTQIKSWFTFSFSHTPDKDENIDDDDYPMTITVYRFSITGTEGAYRKFHENDRDNQALEFKWADIEGDYGVHDWSSQECELIGFYSYEVEPDMYLECVTKWHEWVAEQGFTVGDIFQPTHSEDGTIIESESEQAENETNGKIIWAIHQSVWQP